uniref:vomeronasal 1 receptor ornAnaV1R3179 n=1 Tax=Ornithorhynchus anatinus TaxID=9258 RepID=UPI00023AC9AF|nr:vomeronasal 1 receptor ornAnaV1R3179 [Ornithorhynchus anatinus]
MDVNDISFGTVLLLQTSTGVSVNVFLLLFYTHMISFSHKISSSDLIYTHMALANTIIFFTYGISETISTWGGRNFLDGNGCKIILCIYRVSRGLVICTTCFLSVFQAIIISPSTSQWWWVKVKLPKCVVPSFVFFWVLNLLIEINTLMYATGPQNSTTVRITYDLNFCSIIIVSTEVALVNAIFLSGRDLIFVAIMSVASGYMVIALHRHHRQVQHLHGPGYSPRQLPEVRAAKRVIILVTLYFLLYGRQSIMLSVLLNMKEKSPLLVKAHQLLAFTFSSVCPFLVIYSDRRVRILCKRDSRVHKVYLL